MDFVKETELFVKEKVVTEMDVVKETKLFVTEKVVTGHWVLGTLDTRIKVVKEQPQLHMTNTKVSSHVGHACTEEIMIQQFTRKIT